MAGRTWTGTKLLDHILESGDVTPDMIDTLLREREREGQHLEFKDSKVLDRKDAPDILRQYVAGYANTEGGVFIVGIAEPDRNDASALRTISGCPSRLGDLAEWASRSLTPIASYLLPPPRFHVVEHGLGKLLVVAVARAPNLVPVIVNGRASYWFRMGDQTVLAPDSHYADLVLGRRAHPTLVLSSRIVSYEVLENENGVAGALELELRIKNESLSWVKSLLCCVVAYVDSGDMMMIPTAEVLRYVDADPSLQRWTGAPLFMHHDVASGLVPFEECTRFIHFQVPVQFNDRDAPYRWRAVALVIAQGSMPTAFQFDLLLSPRSHRRKDNSGPVALGERGVVSIAD